MTDVGMPSSQSGPRSSHATVLQPSLPPRLVQVRHANPSAESMMDLSINRRPFYDTETPPAQTDADEERGSQEPLAASSGATHHYGGIELSMDGVTLRRPKPWWLRRRMVTQLDSCSLRIPSGSVHCITSLSSTYSRCALAVLAGARAVAHAEGAALTNAYPTTALRYRRQVGYVTSLDGILLEATVFENLPFATQLRFHVDAQRGRELIRKAAADVLLTDYLGIRASLLSPARRHLLALAMELVAEPIVLLLEDPLSFFSLAHLQLFVRMLHRLRHRSPSGTVVWSGSTIPWTLFDDIDSLTLLSTDGRTFYTGHKKDVEAFLQEDLGFLRVPGEAVVDIMAQTEVDTAAVTHASYLFWNSRYHRQLQQDLQAHRARIAMNAFATLPDTTRAPPRYLRVQWLLLAYALRGNVLGRVALVLWAGLFVVILLVCALVALTDGEEKGNMHNVRGALFFLLSCSVQINSIFVKAELRNWRMFQLLTKNLYISVTPYFVATIVRVAAPRLCFALAGWICAAVIFQKAAVVSLGITMALTSFTHACLGLVAVYWFPRFVYLLLLNHIYYGYCVISGFLVNPTSIPRFFQFLSILRIGYGGLLAAELRSRTFGCDSASSESEMESGRCISSHASAALTPSAPCYTGQQYLYFIGLSDDSWGMSVLILLALSVGITITLGLSMHITSGATLLSST
ncbi:conserved hypothetical protein [Leishmania major strain Friedlin]|uniref:ABC transporter domain-containing protein n=1 Tax=Leishmania major TaxID=5664 RepID=E9ADE9_LEIMA|nr:conserved hypothetical protein [Leishmania major strain Friedlin]CAG9576777.1 hypothetical_protein_-_conserved [Leishmania major strain Friedlin]CBZ12237.1 conserved hypothetical protein [Leishmania major strain Friedlin]|eukprot:XP_003721978.1 conserved hypothetical protein [Leishmania major strain Friedlin]